MASSKPPHNAAPLIRAEQSLGLLEEQGRLLAATPESALGEPVPDVPGWTVEDVLLHTARGDRWVAEVLRSGPQADLAELSRATEIEPRGSRTLARYQECLDALLSEFARHDLAEPAATFVGPRTVGWWARRRACENTIHRHDAQSAYQASPAPADPAAAADGVDEWAQVLLPVIHARNRRISPDSLNGKQLALIATDVPLGHWILHLGADLTAIRVAGDAVRSSTDGPNAALCLPAWELFLTVWRRIPLDFAAVTGEVSIVRHVYDDIRI